MNAEKTPTNSFFFQMIKFRLVAKVSPRLLRGPRGRMPVLPHLRQRRQRRTAQVQLPLPQRHRVQPGLLHLRLVVQLRLLHGDNCFITLYSLQN